MTPAQVIPAVGLARQTMRLQSTEGGLQPCDSKVTRLAVQMI